MFNLPSPTAYFRLDGRLNRKPFLFFVLIYFVTTFLLAFAQTALMIPDAETANALYFQTYNAERLRDAPLYQPEYTLLPLLVHLLLVPAYVRRLQDLNLHAPIAVFFYAPQIYVLGGLLLDLPHSVNFLSALNVITFLAVIALCALRGTKGDNAYGPCPLDGGTR